MWKFLSQLKDGERFLLLYFGGFAVVGLLVGLGFFVLECLKIMFPNGVGQ